MNHKNIDSIKKLLIMNICEKTCLIDGCRQRAEYYVNHSRYHLVCESHLLGLTQTSLSQKCSNCSNIIKVIRNLPNRKKTDYEKSFSKLSEEKKVPFMKSFTPIENPKPEGSIQQPKINSSIEPKLTRCAFCNRLTQIYTQLCEHPFCPRCENYYRIDGFCKKCKCSFCTKYFAKKLDCSHKGCRDHNSCNKCCFNCKQVIKTKLNKILDCKHLVCKNCFDYNSLCPCKLCEICETERPVKRDCLHKVCKNCEVYDECRKCQEKPCSVCQKVTVLVKNTECEHKSCKDCNVLNKGKCSLCKKVENCSVCNKTTESPIQNCSHIICKKCFQKLNFCIFCKENPENYQCNNCKKYDVLSVLSCGHKFCEECSEFNDVYNCSLCEKFQCRQCECFLSLNYKFCTHNLCKTCAGVSKCSECDNFANKANCGLCGIFECLSKGERCDHRLCVLCKNIDKNCAKCNPKCLYCKVTRPVTIPQCRHGFCKSCCELVNEINSCIFCSGQVSNFSCKTCERVLKDLKIFECGHRFCLECNSFEFCKDCNSKTCDKCQT